jgi:redox-sensitive bicupin YhaK (pirin superfamily)
VPKDRLPVVEGAAPAPGSVMGSLWGAHLARAPATARPSTRISPSNLAEACRSTLRDERALYVAEGEATLDGLRLEPRVLYVLRPGISATLRSETGAHVMLCGGAPMDGPRHVWWNFVSSRRERIQQAKEDWKALRFPMVPEEKEWIPIPEVPKTVSYP